MIILNLNLRTLDIIMVLVGIMMFAIMASIVIFSVVEKEKRATTISVILTLILPLFYLLPGLLNIPFQPYLSITILSITGLVILLFILPVGNKIKNEPEIPDKRHDERDVIFSRWKLEEGTKNFEEYYHKHPEKKPPDEIIRNAPGILSKGSSKYHPILFPATEASDDVIGAIRGTDFSPSVEKNLDLKPESISKFLKNWILYLGAHSVGITLMKDYHYYSHKGRGSEYGNPIKTDHKFALVFTTEMDRLMNRTGPEAPTCMETNKQYLAVAIIATQIGHLISRFGYSAKTHIDGNYRVICPLLARDAGLGEIGRMGILMTPKLGPRIRIAIVTTDLSLIPDKRKRDSTMMDLCKKCLKCAIICPTGSISHDDPKVIDGVRQWKISHETCFTYWSKTGTDCGRCMSVCPYSHPDNFFHNTVRAAIRNSALFRKIAVPLDDLFYGRKPKPMKLQKWLRV